MKRIICSTRSTKEQAKRIVDLMSELYDELDDLYSRDPSTFDDLDLTSTYNDLDASLPYAKRHLNLVTGEGDEI